MRVEGRRAEDQGWGGIARALVSRGCGARADERGIMLRLSGMQRGAGERESEEPGLRWRECAVDDEGTDKQGSRSRG